MCSPSTVNQGKLEDWLGLPYHTHRREIPSPQHNPIDTSGDSCHSSLQFKKRPESLQRHSPEQPLLHCSLSQPPKISALPISAASPGPTVPSASLGAAAVVHQFVTGERGPGCSPHPCRDWAELCRNPPAS